MPRNTFEGMNKKFPNRGIHVLVTETLEWRIQMTTRPERKTSGGWDNAINEFMMQGLEDASATVERITYSPTSTSKEELEQRAADTSRTLKADYDGKSINSDNTVMPPAPDDEVAYDLSGAHPNFPQPTSDEFPNAFFRAFVKGLDGFIVDATRLTSRNLPATISKFESVILRNRLNELYAICQEKGGEEKRKDIPTGTLPSQEPQQTS